MKKVYPPIRTIDKICGKQKYKEDVEYRPTKHCLLVPCEGGKLLYHTLTQSLLFLERQDLEHDLKEELVSNWFLVPQGFDECKHADGVRNLALLLRNNNTKKTSFTILTTTDCNARCFYCYEMGVRRYSMTPQTARDVGNYIVRSCGGRKVTLSWFGGEPLYNPGAVDVICEVLRQGGIEYSSIMTSNGYYLDEQTAKRAVQDWHVASTQITIDGTEAVYNRTKAFIDRDTENPYARVLHNIGTALDAGMEIIVRMNMDEANAADLFLLADELGERFKHREKLYAHVILLQKYVGDIHAFASREAAENARKTLTAKLKKLGLAKPERLTRDLHINQCMADNDSCEVILPDGRIEKCEHISETQVIGSIYDSERDIEKIRDWKKTIRYKDCAECELYPMCCNLELCPRTAAECDRLRQEDLKNRIKNGIHRAFLEAGDGQTEDVYENEERLHGGGGRW